VVLNTCCIRENADQKLYGTLGSLKALVDAKPGLQIAVGGCLAQKDRELIQQKVGWVDVVFGTHNLTSAPGLLRRAATEGPVMEILDAPDAREHLQPPHGSRCGPRAALRGLGHHPDGLRQLVRLLHRAVGARPRGEPALDDIVAEVEGWPGAG
jgi:tRNA A37 methylthiotransferase MiaB